MLEPQPPGNTGPGSDERTTRKRKRGSRTVMSYVPVIAASLGITLVITSVVFFYVEDDVRRLMSVTFGLGILIAGVWFAANPFLQSQRRFTPLRNEVDAFIDLVRIVNRQTVEAGSPEDIERTKARMHEAVDHIVAVADKRS